MSYHLKGAQYRCAEMLEAKGMKLTKEEIKVIKVMPIKQAGNSIVVNVLEAILRRLLDDKEE